MPRIHGGDAATYRTRFPNRKFLDFSANISPFGMPDSARRALLSCADACESYPDPHCRDLIRSLSDFEEVPQEWIVCGNGAADLIFRCVSMLRPQTALVADPCFAEYEAALLQHGCRVLRFKLEESRDFELDKTILPMIRKSDLVFLANPNNPTGRLADRNLLMEILNACRSSGAVLILDECFLDFVPDGGNLSLKHRLREYDSLIVLKAFTKLFAMPGLRLGYALCANRTYVDALRETGAPWSVSVPAQVCGIAAAGEKNIPHQLARLIQNERPQIEAALRQLGCRVIPGQANFILFYTACMNLAQTLALQGILIRDCRSFAGLGPGWYRTAVRLPQENEMLMQALHMI